MPLPPLEESLVRMLRSIAGDDEISQYDTVYTEMKKSARSVKTNEVFPFPDDDKSYADEDMLRDARKLTHTIAAMPNNAIIDDSALGKEECDDAPEVSAAVAAAGTRVTVLTTSEASRRDPLSPGFYTLSSYENLCATGPQVTDLSILKMRYTNRISSVQTGDLRNFASGAIILQGAVNKHLAGHIQWWEADDNNGGFYYSLRNMLKEAAEAATEAAVQTSEAEDWSDSYASVTSLGQDMR
ncbi:hypothetical protein MMC21_008316 [Puttea exsequens]|nr:hypothetical protein [Puttea exsequens]